MDKELLKAVAKKSFTDFLRLEDGKAGKKNALAFGTAIGATVLAQMLLGAMNDAEATSTHGHSIPHSQASF